MKGTTNAKTRPAKAPNNMGAAKLASGRRSAANGKDGRRLRTPVQARSKHSSSRRVFKTRLQSQRRVDTKDLITISDRRGSLLSRPLAFAVQGKSKAVPASKGQLALGFNIHVAIVAVGAVCIAAVNLPIGIGFALGAVAAWIGGTR